MLYSLSEKSESDVEFQGPFLFYFCNIKKNINYLTGLSIMFVSCNICSATVGKGLKIFRITFNLLSSMRISDVYMIANEVWHAYMTVGEV